MGSGGELASRKVLVVAGIGGAIILGLTIAVIVLAVEDDKEQEIPIPQNIPPVTFDLMTYFDVPDGLKLRWFHDLKNGTDLERARAGKYDVINVIVTVASGRVPVIDDRRYQLHELIGSVRNDKFVLSLEMHTNEIAQAALDELKAEAYTKPVILSVPVLSGFDLKRFQTQISDIKPNMPIAVNLDLTAVCCDGRIGSGTVEYIAGLANDFNHTITIGVDAAILDKSWTNIKWLLNKGTAYKLVISSKELYTNDTVYDILLARNDLEIDRVYYNLKKTLYNELVSVATSAGNPLIYFNITPRDAGNLIWSHNTDTWDLIHKATAGDTMMVEGDIRLQLRNNISVLVMAHDKGDDNNVTFEQWLNEVIKVDKGMKLDFKEIEAVEPALKMVTKYRNLIKGPVWSNADVLPGPGNKTVTIPAEQFLLASQKFPAATLSLGWTTMQKGTKRLQYSMYNVKQMHELCKNNNIRQPVTFPVRAEQALDSWLEFDWLLKQSWKYSLTIWTGHGDNVTKTDMDMFKRKFEMSRVYFDLPIYLRPTLP